MKNEGLRKACVVVESEGVVFHYTGYVLVGDLALTIGDPNHVIDAHYGILERIIPSDAFPGFYEFAGDQSLEIENVDASFRERLAAAPDAVTALSLFNEYQARQDTSANVAAA